MTSSVKSFPRRWLDHEGFGAVPLVGIDIMDVLAGLPRVLALLDEYFVVGEFARLVFGRGQAEQATDRLDRM